MAKSAEELSAEQAEKQRVAHAEKAAKAQRDTELARRKAREDAAKSQKSMIVHGPAHN